MPTASRFGTRNATRRNWRASDRSRSRSGPRGRSWPNPFTQLEVALRALVRFHESHSVGQVFQPAGSATFQSPPLDPEWEAAIDRAYHLVPGSTRVSRVHPGVPPGNAPSPRSCEFV